MGPAYAPSVGPAYALISSMDEVLCAQAATARMWARAKEAQAERAAAAAREVPCRDGSAGGKAGRSGRKAVGADAEGTNGVVVSHLAGIVVSSCELLRHVEGPRIGGAARDRSAIEPHGRSAGMSGSDGLVKVTTPFAQLIGRLDAAHYCVEKTARDVPRLPSFVRPTAEHVAEIRVQSRILVDRAQVLM